MSRKKTRPVIYDEYLAQRAFHWMFEDFSYLDLILDYLREEHLVEYDAVDMDRAADVAAQMEAGKKMLRFGR